MEKPGRAPSMPNAQMFTSEYLRRARSATQTVHWSHAGTAAHSVQQSVRAAGGLRRWCEYLMVLRVLSAYCALGDSSCSGTHVIQSDTLKSGTTLCWNCSAVVCVWLRTGSPRSARTRTHARARMRTRTHARARSHARARTHACTHATADARAHAPESGDERADLGHRRVVARLHRVPAPPCPVPARTTVPTCACHRAAHCALLRRAP